MYNLRPHWVIQASLFPYKKCRLHIGYANIFGYICEMYKYTLQCQANQNPKNVYVLIRTAKISDRNENHG